jgi:autotransporter translocation and assembly factor TamB
MRALRRLLQVVAVVGTLMVGILAVALIVSQTPWFRDWLRRYIVRESKQYLNGDLAIGRLGGNLLFGVQLGDVALDVSGEQVVAVKNLELDYSVFRIISSGMVMDEIKVDQPTILLERGPNGWNLAQVVKKEEKEADREGPGSPLSLPSIQVTDANVTIRDRAVGTSGYTLPRQIRDLDVKASYEYEPVRYTLVIDHLSFRGAEPQLQVGQLAGKISVRDDNVYVEQLKLNTAESTLTVDGVVEQYLKKPVVKLTTSGRLSVPEIGRVVPAATGYQLHPGFEIRANGPADRLALDLNLRSEAGNVQGQLTADVEGPAMGAEGSLQVERLDLARLLKDPAQRSDITGRARLDIEVAGTPKAAPILERTRGTFSFTGPRVVVAGYQASAVNVGGRIQGSKISLDGRAAAYGGTATAKGFVVAPAANRPLSFDLQGSAKGLDLRNLPASTGAPQLATNLSIARYRVRGSGKTIEGEAQLNRSTVEGATVADGTVATFSLEPHNIRYSAKGSIADLDLQRLGRKLEIAALARPAYASDITGAFDVTGSMPRRPAGTRKETDSAVAEMTLSANGTLKNSEIMGGSIPDLSFQVNIADGAVQGQANGRFENFDPAALASRPELKGNVSGMVNATFAVADLSAPITPETITADGQVTLERSSVGGLQIDTLNVNARLADAVATVNQLTLTGPDVKADVTGQLALNETSASNLKYRVEAINIPELARLAGQPAVGGSAALEGTVTGNRASLTTTGTLDGSNLSYNGNSALDLNSQYTVTIPDLDFAKATVEATTDGTFIKAAGLEITQLTATTTYKEKTLDFSTNIKEKTRELDARGSVILHPDHQEVHLPELAVRTQGVEWRTKPATEAVVQYGQNRVLLKDVDLVSNDQSLSVNGEISLNEVNPEAALKVTAQNVDLQQLETLLLQNRGMTGRLSADATITGTTKSPIVDGRVEIQNGGFQNYKYQSFVADIDYQGRRAALDATLQQSATEQITVKGSVPMSLFRRSQGPGHVEATAGEEVDLHIKSTQLGLGLLQGFTTLVTDVQGTLEADVRLTGSGEDPHLDGHIDIKNGAFGVPLGGVSYSGLNTRIDLTPDQLRLQSFSILDEEGERLNVAGSLAVHEKSVGAVNITVTSDNFELIDNQLGDVGVDTNIQITGEVRRPKVQGSVKIEAGRLEVDELLTLFYDPYATESLPQVVSAERMAEGSGSAEEATKNALARANESAAPPGAKEQEQKDKAEGEAKAAAAEPTIFDALEMDVHLLVPDNLVLRGEDLRPGGPTGAALGDMNITVGGDIQARKSPGDQVRIYGTVQTVRGTYEFQGRRFELDRGGRLRFVGDTQINPFIDVSATRLIPNTGVEAKIRVTGTAKAPELALSSTPPLEESDILALIVFNRPVNELGTGERSSLAATAGGIATGFIAAPLGESIGRALDLDLFEITTQTDEGDLGAGVTLGQQVGERAFFKLRQTFGDRSTTEFMLEYQLARFLRLQATAAPEASNSGNRLNQRRVERGGLDLIFFFSY